MATVAFGLTAYGTAAGAYGAQAALVLGVSGSLVGSYLDQKYVYPALFGVDDANTPNIGANQNDALQSLTQQSYSEGSEGVIAYGEGPRFAGTVIWAGDIIDENPDFYRHVACLVCRNPVDAIVKIYMNTKVVYDEDLQSTTATNFTYIGSTLTLLVGTDYTDNTSAGFFTLGGWDNPALNGEFGGFVDPGFLTFYNMPDPGAQSGPYTVFQQKAAIKSRWDGLRFHLGDPDEPRDPLIEAIEGPEYPAHRGWTYVTFEKLHLRESGNQIPTFNFVVKRFQVEKTEDILADVLVRAGFTVNQFNIGSGLDQENGYVVAGITSPVQQLRPLLFRHNIIMQEDNGVFYFFPRENADVINLSPDLMSAHEENDRSEKPFLITDIPEDNIPGKVYVKYSSRALDFQQGTQSDQRTDTQLDRTQIINLTMTIPDQEARDLATRELYRYASERQTCQFQLPPSMLDVLEGDVITVSTNDQAYKIFVTKIARGSNFLVKCEGIIQDDSTFMGLESAIQPASFVVPTPPNVPELVYQLLDSPPLVAGDETLFILYILVSIPLGNLETDFVGADLYESSDDILYNLVGGTQVQHILGETLSVFPDATDRETFESGYSVDVSVFRDTTLLNATTTQILDDGANLAKIGDEYFHYTTATILGTNQWRLEGQFLRGAKDTFNQANSHTIGESFAIIDATVARLVIPADLSGQTRYYKLVSAGENPDPKPSTTIIYEHNTLRPFAPGTLQGSFTGNDSIDLSWSLRSRRVSGAIPDIDTPLADENSDSVRIEVLDAPAGNVVRTIDDTTGAYKYQRADILSDGFALHTIINFRFYALNDDQTYISKHYEIPLPPGGI